MLLKAEDGGTFEATLEKGREVRAGYKIAGQVSGGQTSTQADTRTFASEEDARLWLKGEASKRGFDDFKLKVQD